MAVTECDLCDFIGVKSHNNFIKDADHRRTFDIFCIKLKFEIHTFNGEHLEEISHISVSHKSGFYALRGKTIKKMLLKTDAQGQKKPLKIRGFF
jgi:hypothetical protein